MVWGWDFLYSPSSFLSVIHNTWSCPRSAATACVLPHEKKRKSTYELLFETFKDVAREKDVEIKVETIRTDFEEAAIKAATKVFDVGIECCFFHLCNLNY